MSTSPFVLLPSSHARYNDTFPAASELEGRLRKKIRGEVRFDAASKALYATDGSNYRHIPIGVVIPLDEADVIATVAICHAANAPLLSRGAGTSLGGQGCNFAVILPGEHIGAPFGTGVQLLAAPMQDAPLLAFAATLA